LAAAVCLEDTLCPTAKTNNHLLNGHVNLQLNVLALIACGKAFNVHQGVYKLKHKQGSLPFVQANVRG
jgi:riboflavin synthase alpha subunit